MDFKEYLHSKKIDAMAFGKNEPELFGQLKKVFDQVHPDSFTSQKLFLINPLRRKYRWRGEQAPMKSKLTMMKPKINKPKINKPKI